MLTAYQLIDQRFGHTLHKVTAGLFLLTRAAAEECGCCVSIVVGSRSVQAMCCRLGLYRR